VTDWRDRGATQISHHLQKSTRRAWFWYRNARRWANHNYLLGIFSDSY